MWGLEEPEELRGVAVAAREVPKTQVDGGRGNPHWNGALGTRMEHVEIPFSFPK